ncbi:MAG: hypothetical protein ABIJ97_17785, partial [Bacteroidota bacterium]
MYNIKVEASIIGNSTGFYDFTSSEFHFAIVGIELVNSLSFVVGDNGLALPGLQLINDSSIDIFKAGTSFSIEIAEGHSLFWNFPNSISIDDFVFTANSSNNRILNVTCSSDHTENQTYNIDSLIISAGEFTASGRILLKFDQTSYTSTTDSTIRVFEPSVKLENTDLFISTDTKARSLSKITISNSTPSILNESRNICVVLPVGFEWDVDNLPILNSGGGNVTLNDDSKQLDIDITSTVNGSEELIGGKIKNTSDSYKAGNIIVKWNNNTTQFTSNKQIHLVQPVSITFNEYSWIIGDQARSLGTFNLNFDGAPFNDDYYLFLKIPDEVATTFQITISMPDWATTVYRVSSKLLRFSLKTDNSASSKMWTDGISIYVPNEQENFKFQLALLKKDDYSNYDEQNWESNTEIYIKEPSHKLMCDNVLLCQKGDQVLSNITLTQSTISGQSVFRSDRIVSLTLPNGLEWKTNGLVHEDTDLLISADPSTLILKCNKENNIPNILEITNIQINTDNANPIQPQAISISYDDNINIFETENTVRAGFFNQIQQADTSFIIGDSTSVIPSATISQSNASPPLLIPGYSLILQQNNTVVFNPDWSPDITPNNLSVSTFNTNKIQVSSNDEISSDIQIDNLFVSNIIASGINHFIWAFQNDNAGELIPLDTMVVYVGNVIKYQYVDKDDDEFRYPTYILGDSTARKFPAIQIIAEKDKQLFRKNRTFTFQLPEGISWNNHSYNQYTIIEDQATDTLIHDGLFVHEFSMISPSYLAATVNNNYKKETVIGQLIKVVDPSIELSDPDQSSQTFWLNNGFEKEAAWNLKEFVLRDPQINGYIPSFGIRLRITNTNDLEFIDKGQEIYYGSTQLSDVITTNTIIIDDAGQIWNNDDVSFSQIAVNVKEIFENAQIEFCLTEFPYYWKKCDFGLYANDPSVEIPRTAFLVGDSGLVFPDIDLNDFNHLPIDSSGTASLDIVLPDGFPAAWEGETDEKIRKEFNAADIGSSKIISDLSIGKINAIFSPQPLKIRSSEYQYAVDATAAYRETHNTIQVGNPSVYFSSAGPDKRLKYRFCVNDPNFTIDTIKIAEDSVPAMLVGDTIYIQIEQNNFQAKFIDSDIGLSSGIEAISIDDQMIKLKILEDFTGSTEYNISEIQIGNFKNNVQEEYTINVYLRNPNEPGHPVSNIAALEIGKPIIKFIDASMEHEYYISTESENISLNSIISIQDDPLFPVIDTEGLLLILQNLDLDSAIGWDSTYNNRAIWFQGSGIRKLTSNKIIINNDSLYITLNDTLNPNDVLKFKPLNLKLNQDGVVRIKISNNYGNSYLDSCTIYFSNPECKFTSGDQKILKFKEQVLFDNLIINSVYGIGDSIWIYLPDGLNCTWDTEEIDSISITNKNDENIYNSRTTIVLQSDAGKGKILQLGLDNLQTWKNIKDSLIISNLPIKFQASDPSSHDSLLVFWDDPSYKKLSVTCENKVTIGSPTVELSDNVYLYSSDVGNEYILPYFQIQDDPIAQFITGSESVMIKIPEAMKSSISFNEFSELKWRIENDTIKTNVLRSTDSLFIIQLLDSAILNRYNNKTMHLFGLSCSIIATEQTPTSLKYYFKDFPFPDSKKIRIANPSVRFINDNHFQVDPQGNINLGDCRLIVKEGVIPGLRSGKNIELDLSSNDTSEEIFHWETYQNSQVLKIGMNKEKLIVKINPEFQGNDSTYFSDIKWTVNLDSLLELDSLNLFYLFPESLSVSINFRPNEHSKPSQPAWYESQNKIHVHLPVFFTEPTIAGNQLKFSAIKGFLNTDSEQWSDAVNFKTSYSDPLFTQSRFDPDLLGIQYDINKRVNETLEEFTLTFNDSALFEMNRMFGEYLKTIGGDKNQKELWIGLDFPNISLSGENGSDYFDWYKSKVNFTGYKPYDIAHVHETGWCFNQEDLFEIDIDLDTTYRFFTDLINLCTGDTIFNSEITEGNNYSFLDTSSQFFNDEGLYILNVSGSSVSDSFEMFPYTRYLLYDTTSPNLDRSSIQPRIVERHSERNRLPYTGLTISIFDKLEF